jgi:hypothetical protein
MSVLVDVEEWVYRVKEPPNTFQVATVVARVKISTDGEPNRRAQDTQKIERIKIIAYR